MKYLVKGIHTIRPVATFKPKNMRKIKDFTIYTASGELLDFGSQVDAPEDINEGMTATISSENITTIPDGDYVMPDGAIWKFKSGTLTEMGEPTTDSIGVAAITAIRIKGEVYHWIAGKKKFMRVCAGVRLSGKLYVPSTNGKFMLAKDQSLPGRFIEANRSINRSPGKCNVKDQSERFANLRINRNPGKPILGI